MVSFYRILIVKYFMYLFIFLIFLCPESYFNLSDFSYLSSSWIIKKNKNNGNIKHIKLDDLVFRCCGILEVLFK